MVPQLERASGMHGRAARTTPRTRDLSARCRRGHCSCNCRFYSLLYFLISGFSTARRSVIKHVRLTVSQKVFNLTQVCCVCRSSRSKKPPSMGVLSGQQRVDRKVQPRGVGHSSRCETSPPYSYKFTRKYVYVEYSVWTLGINKLGA